MASKLTAILASLLVLMIVLHMSDTFSDFSDMIGAIQARNTEPISDTCKEAIRQYHDGGYFCAKKNKNKKQKCFDNRRNVNKKCKPGPKVCQITGLALSYEDRCMLDCGPDMERAPGKHLCPGTKKKCCRTGKIQACPMDALYSCLPRSKCGCPSRIDYTRSCLDNNVCCMMKEPCPDSMEFSCFDITCGISFALADNYTCPGNGSVCCEGVAL